MATGRVRTVSVRVTAEVSDLEKKLAGVQKTLKKTGKKFKDVGAGISKAFTAPVLAAGAAAFKFIQDASDMGETQAKIGELFDQSAGKIDRWSDTAATAFGQSKQQAMDAAATFAIFGKSAGLGGDDLVGFSTELTELASDLASFNNTSPEEAIEAIGSALRGEAEPLRKYGVLLDDASLRNEALKLGLIETTKNALTPQQKVLAANALILAQTGSAQGDFARTSDGLANQQRILAAQFKDTSAQLGEALLPLAMQLMTVFREDVMPAIQGVVEWFKKLSPQTIKIAAVIGLVLAVVGPLIIGLGFVVSAIGTLIPVFAALLGPVGLVIAIVAALVAGGVLLWKNWDTIKEKSKSIWDSIVGVIRGPVNMILGFANSVISAYEKMLNGVAKAVNAIPSFKIPEWVPGVGGKSFGLPNIPTIKLPKIPMLETGTNFVPKDMFAMLHEGEAIVPSKFNPSAGGGGIVINILGNISRRDDAEFVANEIVKNLRLQGVMP